MARNSLNHDKEKATVLLSVKRNNRWCEALAPRLKIENKIKSALVARNSLNHDKEKATVLLSVKRNNRWSEALAPRLKIENKIKSALVAQG